MMNIEKVLREYKMKKAAVETTNARIEQYKWAMSHPEEWYKDYIPDSSSVLGLPGRPKGSPAPSSVETFVDDKELNSDILKSWIRKEESRIFLTKLEVTQIEIALNSLNKQERYIIELKYFDDMFWRDIEVSFNGVFRAKNYVTFETLKKMNKDALSKLTIILEPFYDNFKIA
jgi:hypothetical protein